MRTRIAALAASAALAAIALGGTAAAQTKDPENRMDLGEFYATHVGDYQPGVEAQCGCTGAVIDRSRFQNRAPHKTIEYADTADHAFRVTYVRAQHRLWAVESKAVVADGQVFPFRSARG